MLAMWLTVLGCSTPSDSACPCSTEAPETASPDTAPPDTVPPDTAPPDTVPRVPKVVMIILDDFGVDVIDAYSDHALVGEVARAYPDTPTLSALCTDGVRFDHAWANPTCTPSRGTLLTGQYGFRTGLDGVGDFIVIDPDQQTLPGVLSTDPDFRSASIGKWHLGYTEAVGGLSAPNTVGWHHFSGVMTNAEDYWEWTLVTDGKAQVMNTYLTTAQVDAAIAWWTAQPEETPRLLWVGLTAPHSPFHFPPDALHSQDTAEADEAIQYDAAVEAVDAELSRLLAVLDEETLVLFLGDNGTPPRAVRGHYPHGQAKATLYQGGVTIPLCAVGPGVGRGVHEGLVSTVDLFATVVDYFGTALPADIDGVSLLDVLADPAAEGARTFAYTEQNRSHEKKPRYDGGIAIRSDRYKWIHFSSGEEHLYDIIADPIEDTDLIEEASYQDEVAALQAIYQVLKP